MNFDNRRGILGSPMGVGPSGGMDRGILGAPPGAMRGGVGMPPGRGMSGMGAVSPLGMRDIDLKSRMMLEDDMTRSRHSQFTTKFSSDIDAGWDGRRPTTTAYGNDSDMDRLQQLQRLQFSANDGILGEPGLGPRPDMGMGGLGRIGGMGMAMDDNPRPLFQQRDVDRFRATHTMDVHSGRGRRRDRMDSGRSGRSPSPRRHRERSPIGMQRDYDPSNPTGDGDRRPMPRNPMPRDPMPRDPMPRDPMPRDPMPRDPMPRDRESRGGNTGITVCHACHLDLGSNQRWREHMQSDGHMMVMQELGCKAEQQAFHLKREMRDNLRRRRRSGSAERADTQGSPKRYKEKESNNFCNSCEKEFFGPFQLHCELPDHRKKKSMMADGCRWCKVTRFERFKDLQAHRASEEHLQKQRDHDEERERRRGELHTRRHGARRDSSPRTRVKEEIPASKKDDEGKGSASKKDDREADVDMVETKLELSEEIEITETKMEEPEESQNNGDSQSAQTESEPAEPAVEEKIFPATTLADLPAEHNPNMALGQNYIKQVTGYFCKLCRRFYSNEDLAYLSHCKSEAHFLKLKAYLQQKSGGNAELSDDD